MNILWMLLGPFYLQAWEDFFERHCVINTVGKKICHIKQKGFSVSYVCLCCGFFFVRCLDSTFSNRWKLIIAGTWWSWAPVCILPVCAHCRTKRKSVTCLEAAPKISPFLHKVISPFQPDAFPGPASWSELLWDEFVPLAQRQLIHPLFFSYSP